MKDKRAATSPWIADEQLKRLERFFPLFGLLCGVLIVSSARWPIIASLLLVFLAIFNLSLSSWRYRKPQRIYLIERLRFPGSVLTFAAILYSAGPSSPGWLAMISGAIWIPVAVRERTFAVFSVGILVLMAFGSEFFWFNTTSVEGLLVPPLVILVVAFLTAALLGMAVASERAAAAHILDSVESTVFTCDVSGRINYVNQPISPYTRERMLGANIMEFTPESERERVSLIVSGVLSTHNAAIFDIRTRGAKGRLWFRVSLSPMVWEDRVHGLVFVLNDITDQKNLEADLTRARDSAERLSRARSEFLAVVNHEVRTPVNALLAGLELLEATLPRLTPSERGLLATMKKSGVHLRSQVNSLLDMSRFTHKKEQLRLEAFDLRALVDEMLAMYSLQLAPGVSLKSNIEAELPCHMYSDSQRWQTILRNLLSNAVKFTSHGSIFLEVAWATAARNSIRMTVEDTGSGIAAEHRAQIFEPFAQFTPLGARNLGGVGLGLSLCGANVHLLGGTIELESEVGRGSRFTCVLPVEPCLQWKEQGRRGDSCGLCPHSDKSAMGLKAQPDATFGSEYRSALARLRVLIVEDDAVNRMVLEKLLHREGVVQVAVAATGDEALTRTEQESFDVILLDMHLPDISGTETARIIRSRGWKGRMIAVTADTTPDMQDMVFAAGIDHFSPKPLDMADLMASIRLELAPPGGGMEGR